jgi:hypothetical protein
VDPRPDSLSDAQRSAVEQTWDVASELLEVGVQAAGLVRIRELSRAVHSCRLAGLPRLAAAGGRVAQQARALHAQRPEFRLERLSSDFQDLLATAFALRRSDGADARWIGTARRAYTEVGTLRLFGLFTEPVVTGGGYAGVVTYTVDPRGQIWSIGDIAPGDADRCHIAYRTELPFVGADVDHVTTCRSGLILERATAASNGRLGSGQRVFAISVPGVMWSEQPLAGFWDTPLEVQLDRCYAAGEERRAGDDLLFLRCTVVGPHHDAVEFRTGALVFRGIVPGGHAELAYRHNLSVLGASPGLSVMLIGRVAVTQPRTVLLLACEWNGVVNLGLDWLRNDEKRRPGSASPRHSSVDNYDPLDPLKRRLRQVLLGGRATLSPSTWSGFTRDERLLSANHMPTAVQLLQQLRDAPAGGDRLTHAWLAGATYLLAADARLQRLSWLSD